MNTVPQWNLTNLVKAQVRAARSLFGLARYILLGRKARFLLVDTPMHGNLGDQAISIAEMQLLAQLFGKKAYYEISASELDRFEWAYARLSPMNQVILVHGGGFLGALWPSEEYRFRRIIEAYCSHRIIVFPQTAWFDLTTDKGKAFLEDSKNSYETHSRLKIFLRERASYEMLRNNFPAVDVGLVPDVVLALEPTTLHVERHGIGLCLRSDHERALSDGEEDLLVSLLADELANEEIVRIDTVIAGSVMGKSRKRVVREILKSFSSFRFILTDRLHGMIFAAITGTPCIALDNASGKVGGVYEWIRDCEYIRFVTSVNDVREALQSIDLNREWRFDGEPIMKSMQPLVDELYAAHYDREG